MTTTSLESSFRIIPSLALAAALTFALFLGMQLMIDEEFEGFTGTTAPIAPVTMTRPKNHIIKPTEAIEKLPEPKPTPPPLDLIIDKVGPSENTIFLAAPTKIQPVLGKKIGIGVSDREATCTVCVAPNYPERQRARNIEGFVDLEFTITAAGSTKDIVVIGGEPQGVFDRSAIKALKRWKYAPKLVDGEPVERQGQHTRISFKLD